MTLRKKILIGYGVAFVLMALVVAWAVANLVALGRATDAILSENYRSILAAENMVDALERQDSAILLFFLGDVQQGVAQFREHEAVFLEWLSRAKDNITIQGERELVQTIENDYARFRQRFSTLTEIPGDHRAVKEPPLTVYSRDVHPVFTAVRSGCIQLRHLNEETMYTASVEAGRVAGRAIWSTLLVALAALGAALVFSMLLAARITRPLRGFVKASRRISSGDYAVAVPVESRDELGVLAGEFNQMASQLSRYHDLNIEQIIAEKNKGEAILSSIEDGLVVFDTNLKATGINPAARRMLDLAFVDAAPMHCEDILPSPEVCALIRATVDTGAPPELPDEQRIVTLREAGRARHYLFSITVVRGRDNGLSGIVLLLRDVTRLKEVERLKSEFIMAASHELRTPLTSLGMSVDLLLEHVAQDLAPKDGELLRAAHEEVQRMKALVNDLLDLSKIEAGKIALEFERVPVSTLFEHVGSVFKTQAEHRQVTLDLNCPPELPQVRADANKITWVLSNLVSNALRYAPQGGRIVLRANRAGPQVHLSVRDNGPGIPAKYQARIFQKFVQVQGREPGGSGLGLAICKEIVRAHGGSIWVESAEGAGSTFTFTLPVAQ